MMELKIRVNIVAEENIRQKIINYMKDLSGDKIIIDSQKPGIIVKLDLQKNYWIVDIEVISWNYLRFIPFLNLMFYKMFFLYSSQVDPIKINVIKFHDINPVFSFVLLNLSFWGLFSFVSNEVIKEKIKRTSLIVPSVNLLIFSKVLVSSLIFVLVLFIHLLVFGGIGISNIFYSVLSFMVIVYIYGFISWVIKNTHILSILNLSIGFFIITLPFYTNTFILDMNPLHFFTLLVLGIFISLIAISKNKELQKLAWE
ncbi:MAG: hypothetical protein RMJ51_00415 [Candidatus Calescibacterium sp.]|nr:hypothetical protein [Candidatus Calescibacterium sp.]MDW8194699.1 hypothetical protein [Candidatus Calescibacterium sp.]